MTTKPTPAPDLTALSDAELIGHLIENATEHGSNVNDKFFKGGIHRRTLAEVQSCRAELLRRLTRAAEPETGRVTISERTRWAALDALRDRERDYQHARELDPHYAATVQCGSAWSDAIAELTALSQAGTEGETE
jgi:hypothetical protein